MPLPMQVKQILHKCNHMEDHAIIAINNNIEEICQQLETQICNICKIKELRNEIN